MTLAQKCIRLLTAVLIGLAPASGFAADETYFFRFKPVEDWTKGGQVPVDPEEQEKDISAFFAAGVGMAFEQKLPMRSDWQDDSWSVISGALPSGISFDMQTRSFKGVPSSAGRGVKALLKGIDASGREVATASVTFDVFDIEGELLTPNFYGHTGHYSFNQLPVPTSKTVHSWSPVDRLPSGVSLNGRNYEGAPAKAGIYPITLRGMDYLGNVIATYIGTYTVEDGPTFPDLIADDIAKLPQTGGRNISFGAPSTFRVNNGISGLDKVRYHLEIAADNALPGSVYSNDDAKNLRIAGSIQEPYQTASVRFRAVDVDGTKGYSNWFRFGTSDPQPTCGSSSNPTLWKWQTGVAVNQWVPTPNGAQGTLSYELVSGMLPPPIELDPVTGGVGGTPTAIADARDVVVRVNVANGGSVVSTECRYTVSVSAGELSLIARTSPQNQHVRVGQTFEGSVEVKGGIPPYTVAFKDPASYPDLAFTTPVSDTRIVGVAGTVRNHGVQTVPLTVTNGDGNIRDGFLTIKGHAALAMPAPGDIVIKRHAAPQALGTISFDAETVVPDLVDGTVQPSMSLNGPALPTGISFDAGSGFTGATSAAAGSYGPYSVTISDYTKETSVSPAFRIVIAERDDMTAGSVTPPIFTASTSTSSKTMPFSVVQPYGASALDIDYVLEGPQLPEGISFDAETGEMAATSGISFEKIGNYGPYTITATDEEGFSAVSEEFQVVVVDMPEPRSAAVTATTANVTGTSEGELPTFVSTPSLREFILPESVYGGIAGVRFLSAEPVAPAGLSFDDQTGVFSGEPTSEFSGSVAVAFEDAKGRRGTVSVPLEVLPYPQVAMSKSSFEIARLSVPTDMAGSMVRGFRGTVSWSLISGVLPSGLNLNPATGRIEGKATATVGTVASGLVLGAVDSVSRLPARTPPFSIEIVAPTSMEFEYSINGADKLIYKLSPDEFTGGIPYTLAAGPAPAYTPSVTGSFVQPVAFSVVNMPSDLTGVTINPESGRLTGSPTRLGTWDIEVLATDAEQRKATATVRIKAELDGYVIALNASNTSKTLRAGEPFRIPDDLEGIKTKNKVGTVSFFTEPAILPDTLSFDPITGAFDDASSFPEPLSNETIYVGAKDDAGRGFENGLRYGFNVIPPLEMPSVATAFSARMFDTSFEVDIPGPLHAMGDITYAISGDVPGTLVTKTYDGNGVFSGYTWTAATKAHVLSINQLGAPVKYTVGGIDTPLNVLILPDGSQQIAPASTYLAADTLLFDPAEGTLTGKPSVSGDFPVSITAFDSHAGQYIRNTSNRVTNNSASASFVLAVEPASPLSVSLNTTTQLLDRYTMPANITATVSNAAYGSPVTWTHVAGTLPSEFTFTPHGTLAISGYGQAEGTWSGIRFRARDVAGRTIDTDDITIQVGPRAPLQIIGPAISYMLVNKEATAISFSTANAANGVSTKPADWTVTGVAGLPDGMEYSTENGVVTIYGTPTTIGLFSGLSISVKDSEGGSANLSPQFRVVSPSDEIVLNATDVTSKVGKPFQLTSSASNTYGTPKFTSPEIAGQYAAEMSLNATSGIIEGTFHSVGDRSVTLSVTDDTSRLTSKTVNVRIIPNLRVTVPSVVQLEQYQAVSAPTDTDYKIGTVKYVKGNPSAWPEGLDVDPDSGKLIGTVFKTGTTVGLFITATDTFGTNVDTQNSNPFDLVVSKAPVEPDIADITGMKLFTATTVATNIVPVVKDRTSGNPWTYGGLTFSLNGSLPQGMTFDAATGTIGGTPAEPSYTEGVSITVTDAEGVRDTTTPFDIAVRDVAAKLPYLADYGSLEARVNAPITARPASVIGKPSGRVTYAIVQSTVTGLSVDPTTGEIGGKVTSGTDGLTYILATDQSGYQMRINGRASTLNVAVKQATLVYPDIVISGTGSMTVVPTSTSLVAPLTFSANKPLPTGFSLDTSTGVISGTTTVGGVLSGYVVTVIDAVGSTASNAFSFTKVAGNHRIVFTAWVAHASLPNCVALSELRIRSASEDITLASGMVPANTHPDHSPASLMDGAVSPLLWANDYRSNLEKAIYFSPPEGKTVTSMMLSMRWDGYTSCSPRSWTVQKADNSGGWTNLWSNTISPAVNSAYLSQASGATKQ